MASGRNYELAATVTPVAFDVAHFFAFELLNQPLRESLAKPSAMTVAFLLALYFAFAVSLYFVGRLQPDAPGLALTLHTRDAHGQAQVTKTTWPQFVFFYPSFGFGIVMFMAVITATGMSGAEGALSDGMQQVALGAVAVIFFVQLGGLLTDVTPRHAPSSPGYLAVLVPVLLISEVMLNLSVALWHRFLGLDAAGPAPTTPSVAGFLVAAPLFLLFFAVPRFTLMSRSFTWPGLASALTFSLWELWQLLDEAPLL